MAKCGYGSGSNSDSSRFSFAFNRRNNTMDESFTAQLLQGSLTGGGVKVRTTRSKRGGSLFGWRTQNPSHIPAYVHANVCMYVCMFVCICMDG